MAVRGYQVSPELLKNSAGRREAIRYLSGFGFQANHTPFQLATQMVQQAGDLKGLTVRVLFNLEFLEVLKDSGVDMARVQFVADTAIEERFARLVFPGVDTVLMDETQWKAAIADPQLLGGLMAKKSMKAADLTLTNPPFNGGVDLKIILAMKDAGLLKRLICVHPSTWLVDVKTQLGPTSGNGNFRKFQNAVREHIKTAELFNGNAVFGSWSSQNDWKSYFALNLSDLEEPFQIPCGPSEGCGQPPNPPVVDQHGQVICWWPTRFCSLTLREGLSQSCCSKGAMLGT